MGDRGLKFVTGGNHHACRIVFYEQYACLRIVSISFQHDDNQSCFWQANTLRQMNVVLPRKTIHEQLAEHVHRNINLLGNGYSRWGGGSIISCLDYSPTDNSPKLSPIRLG